MRVRALETLEEVRKLDGLIGAYIRFVCADLERAAGVSFDAEFLHETTLKSLPNVIPPHGQTFVAEDDDGLVFGMAFLRPSGADAMEIKRLYVTPEARGTGAGRGLVIAAMKAARETGAAALRLDTVKNLTAAIALYQTLGFAYRDPYPESDHFDDELLAPHLVFMEKSL